ncbi:hypothetical protein J4573_18305 [Actinomadura barringtoniae]|uniref:SMP-30/Gluconolactonase/LRE-like region domain-containing protein n=1 Tax=Actinomadura barringtoniae TaxID=1427535 RepID=A0A939T788_9ACTN|nr:hypothetical protein [Actinomadura barringtoniae]MBO2449062.1 hypothetical protein [Actinomadura barringtoniae]
MTSKSIRLLAVALTALTSGTAAQASAAARASADAEASPAAQASAPAPPPVVHGTAPSLHPESAAYDTARHAFLVGSLRHGTVSVVRPDGTVSPLVDDPELISAAGIKIDQARNRLLVANGDAGVSVKSSASTKRRVAGLGIYDLTSGRRIGYVDLAAVAGDGGEHFGNDMAIASDGTAYVTDSFDPVVYRVPLVGKPSVFTRYAGLAGARHGFGANGIVQQAGRLVVGNYSTGRIYRIPVVHPQAVDEVKLAGGPLPGADGFTLRPDGSLVVVTNKVASSGADAVFSLRPAADWSSAGVAEHQAWPDPAPTGAAYVPGVGAYVLSGRLDVLFHGSTSDMFTIRRF